jgi:hypothetical protein
MDLEERFTWCDLDGGKPYSGEGFDFGPAYGR